MLIEFDFATVHGVGVQLVGAVAATSVSRRADVGPGLSWLRVLDGGERVLESDESSLGLFGNSRGAVQRGPANVRHAVLSP